MLYRDSERKLELEGGPESFVTSSSPSSLQLWKSRAEPRYLGVRWHIKSTIVSWQSWSF